MTKLEFLSDEWIIRAREIRNEYQGRLPTVPVEARVNIVITDVASEEGYLHACLLSVDGEIEIDTGHLESADVTISLEHMTAKAILVGGDQNTVVSAFLGGRIRVDGDLTKLLALQTQMGPGEQGPTEEEIALAKELMERLQEMTA